MAKIVLSDSAPKDAGHFSLANAEFDTPFETTDPIILSNAVAHPWLSVENDAAEQVDAVYRETQVRPEDDPLSALNSQANDPAAVQAARDAAVEDAADPVAIDAGLDQSKVVEEGEVAVTLAAADDAPAPKTSRKSASKEN